MAAADSVLRFVLLGEDRTASAALKRVGDSATAAQKKMAIASEKMTAVGRTMTHVFTLPALAVGVASIKMATDFNSAMTRIQTQAGASAKDVQVLSKQVLALGGKVQQGPVELANSLYHLKSVGLDNAQAMTALTQASHLASVGGADLESTTNALAGAWRTGIKGATNFRQAVGTLNAIIGAGNMTMSDLNAALGTGILPAAKTFGLKLKDVGAALAVFTDEGVSADSAATRLKTSLSLLGAPSMAADKVLSGIGLSGHQLGEAMTRPNGLIQAIGLLKSHLEGLNNYYPNTAKAAQVVSQLAAKVTPLLNKTHLDAVQKSLVQQYGMAKDLHLVLQQGALDTSEQAAVLSRAFGGGRTGAAIMSLVNNFSVLQKKQAQVTAGMSKFGADVAAQMKTPQAQFKLLISTLETAGVEIGQKLLPAAVSMAQGLKGLVDGFSALNPTVQNAAGKFALMLAAAGPLLLVAGKLTSAFLSLQVAAKNAGMSTGMFTARAAAGVGAMIAFSVATSTSNKKLKDFATIAGGALAGFAAGGPIGAGIGALATGFLLVATHSNKAELNVVNAYNALKKINPIKVATDNLNSLRQSLDQVTGAYTANTRAAVLNKLQQSGVVEEGLRFGISARTMVNAAMGNAKAMRVASAVAKDYQQRISSINKQIQRTGASVLGTGNEQQSQAAVARINALTKERKKLQEQLATLQQMPGVLARQGAEIRKNAAATASYAGKLHGLPKDVRTVFHDDGVPAAVKNIAELSKKYSLTPKQIKTVITATGWTGTVADVQKVIDHLKTVDNTKANLNNFRQSLTGQLSEAASQASAGGSQIGNAMGAGLDQAIQGWTGSIARHSADLVSNAINAARAAAKVRSPSKKMIELGHNMGKGLQIGLDDKKGDVKKAGSDLIDEVMKGIADKRLSLSTAISKVSSALSSLKSKYSGLISNAKTRVSNLKSTRSGFLNTFTQNSIFGLQQPTDANGNPVAFSFGDLLSAQQANASQAKQLLFDVKTVERMGLSKSLVRQLESQGTSGALQLHALASGSASQIAQLNALDKQTNASLQAAGMRAGNYTRGGSIDADLRAAQKQQKELVNSAHREEHLLKMVEHHLKEIAHGQKKGETIVVQIGDEVIIKAIHRYEHRKGKKGTGP